MSVCRFGLQLWNSSCLRASPSEPVTRCPSAHELRVAFGARHDDIHPDPHGFRGGRHHVVEAVVGLHTEGQRWVWALEGNRQTIRQLLHLFPKSQELQNEETYVSC